MNHVAIVVPDLAAAATVYAETLGATVTEPHDWPSHGVTTVFVELPNTKIELRYPLGENSPSAGFLEKNPLESVREIHMSNVTSGIRRPDSDTSDMSPFSTDVTRRAHVTSSQTRLHQIAEKATHA